MVTGLLPLCVSHDPCRSRWVSAVRRVVVVALAAQARRRVAGESMGEIGLNAAMAGQMNVPVVLLSGDESACAELRGLVPTAVMVAVKQALGQAAAVALHPEEARERLRRGAAEAITRRAQVPPLVLAGPLDVEVDLYGPYMVDLATLVPGVSRGEGGRTVTSTAADFADAYRLVLLLAQLATVKPD